MFDHVFFDFDGTLFDTSPGIYSALDAVQKHFGLDFDRSIYDSMIGPPLKESFPKFFGISEDRVTEAIRVYRGYYGTEGLYECTIYDGVRELIEELRSAGKKIYVATSKPEAFANKILEKKGILHLFDFVGGASADEKTRTEKIDVVRHVISENGLEDKKDSCVLVGDRLYDIKGAHLAGIRCAAILWGFGSRGEFVENNADFILEKPSGVRDMILGFV